MLGYKEDIWDFLNALFTGMFMLALMVSPVILYMVSHK